MILFQDIKNILTSASLPAYDSFFQTLSDACECLENEKTDYRAAGAGGHGGSLLDFHNDDLPLMVIPDFHARPYLLLNILEYQIFEDATVFEAVAAGRLRLLSVGDIMHTERGTRERWAAAHVEFLKDIFTGPAISAEMQEGLSLVCALLELKKAFPAYVHILKGNHENVLNETGGGDFSFMKFVDEGEMCRLFVQNYYGDDILFLIHCFEKELPLVFVSKNAVVSHAEPKTAFSRKEIINARNNAEIIYGFTWTANGEAEEGSVGQIIKNLVCDAEKETEIENKDEIQTEFENENVNQNENDYVYIAGHRPVKDNFALRQGGKFIQIHNVKKQNVAVVKFWKKFSPENDIVSVF